MAQQAVEYRVAQEPVQPRRRTSSPACARPRPRPRLRSSKWGSWPRSSTKQSCAQRQQRASASPGRRPMCNVQLAVQRLTPKVQVAVQCLALLCPTSSVQVAVQCAGRCLALCSVQRPVSRSPSNVQVAVQRPVSRSLSNVQCPGRCPMSCVQVAAQCPVQHTMSRSPSSALFNVLSSARCPVQGPT